MLDWGRTALSDPFVDAPVVRPPDRMMAFFRYFLAPVRGCSRRSFIDRCAPPWPRWRSRLSSGHRRRLGDRVDRRPSSSSRTAGRWPAWASAILVIRPVTAVLSRGLTSIAFVPSLTALVRWRSYRYVLRQSLAFFQNDFAGRIAQKVLQTGPSLRESGRQRGRRHLDVVIYVGGTIVLFAGLDPWLIVPVALWVVAYVVIIWRHGAAGPRQVGSDGRGQFRAVRPHRRQLHQHPDGEALRPCRARGRLRHARASSHIAVYPRIRRRDHGR